MNNLWRVRFVKASQDGQLYLLLGVRVDQIQLMGLRLQMRRLMRPQLSWLQTIRSCLGWLGSVFLFPLWASFEIPIALWNGLEHRASRQWGIRLRGWQRLLFCLAVSFVFVQIVFLRLGDIHLSQWTVHVSAAHGLALHFLGTECSRCCRQILGVRPMMYVDPHDAYAHLDL